MMTVSQKIETIKLKQQRGDNQNEIKRSSPPSHGRKKITKIIITNNNNNKIIFNNFHNNFHNNSTIFFWMFGCFSVQTQHTQNLLQYNNNNK